MDFVLRCNSLKCRSQLTDKAVVTTCSHIFCIHCSETLGLAAANGPHRQCPACRAPLANPDDVVATALNPTEDYKTSVLSGLSPTIIMECANRGLNFWSYQSTQEVVYQEYLAKTLTDKYGNLNVQMDKLVNDANAEIDGLNQRLSQLQIDQEKLKQDNQTLLNALREKNRKHAQTQDLYDRMKRKEMTAATRHAAYDSVDEALHGATSGMAEPRMSGARGFHVPIAHTFAQPEPVNQRQSLHNGIHIRNTSNEIGKQNGFAPRFSPNLAQATPASHHRTRLGGAAHNHFSHGAPSSLLHRGQGIHSGLGQTPQSRRPMAHTSGNASVLRSEISNSGYGISAGMRAGSLQGGLSGPDHGGSSWLR